MAGYTCYSDTDKGCGSYHVNRTKAEACCSIAAKRFGEARTPIRCASRGEMSGFTVGDKAQARRDAWIATRKDTRKGYDTEDFAQTTGGSGGEGQGQGQQAEGQQGENEGQGQQAEGQGQGQQAEGQGQGEGGGDEQHPLQGLADEITPLMADGLAETLAPIVEKAATAVGTGATALKAINKAAKDAAEIIEKTNAELEKIHSVREVEVVIPETGDRNKIEGHTHPRFEVLLKLVGAGENVFMSGPAGSGKTTAAKQVAEALGMELIVQPVALDKFEATGFIDAGGTYRASAVYRWAKSEKPALLLIDEIDGWLPQALVAMNPILDNRLGIFPEGQFEISDKHRVIATANTWGLGADAEYCGRNRLDAASLDRFGARLDWGYDEEFEREIVTGQFGKDAAPVVKASQRIRKNLTESGVKIVWGPRQTLGLARRTAIGMPLSEALDVSALAQLTKSKREQATKGVTL